MMKSKSKIIAIVPARAGSKGLLNKNLRLLHGVPLYKLAVEQGLRVVGEVILTTDIPNIDENLVSQNCVVVKRPEHLARDESKMDDVIMHVIAERGLQGSTIVLLQPTSPLRADADIFQALQTYRQGDFSLVMTVCRKESSVLKYGCVEAGEFTCFKDNRDAFKNRQDLPEVFGPNGAVYVFNVDDFLSSEGFPVRKIGVWEMPHERSIDIDSCVDFRKAEEFFRNS